MKSKKIITAELIALAVLLILFGIGIFSKSKANNQNIDSGENTEQESLQQTMPQDLENNELGELTVTFFDVGKGDCILIEATQGNIMIDTGYEENGEDIVSWLGDNGIDTLDYLILTHPDKDHIGGADIVINNINVINIIDTNCVVDTQDYLEYKQAALDQGIDILTLTSTKEIELGGVKLTIYPPLSTDYAGQNDYSLVTKMIYGETDYLFAADAEEARIAEMLKQIPNIKSMLLKVPYHGALKDNSEEFFEAVAPQYSIITCDKKKMYEDVTKMLQKLNSEVFTTKQGDITVKSDGNTMTISQ
ncbi:MAG: ComEC/Rec2 family competence protein [Lachnotalea sp.]